LYPLPIIFHESPSLSGFHEKQHDVRKEKIQTPESLIDPKEKQFSRSAVEQPM